MTPGRKIDEDTVSPSDCHISHPGGRLTRGSYQHCSCRVSYPHTKWGQSDCSPATLYLHSTSWGFPRVIVQLLLPCNSWDDTAFLQQPACCNQGIPFALQRQTIKVFTGTPSQHCLSQADLGLTTCYRNTGCKKTASLRVQVMSPAAQHRTASQPLAYLLSKCIRSQ